MSPQEIQRIFDQKDQIVPPRALADFETPDGELRDEMKASAIELLSGLGLIPEGGVPFNESPEPHVGSMARYRAQYRKGVVDVYIYTLDQNEQTSSHSHPEPISETLYRLDGVGYQRINGQEEFLPRATIIPFSTSHQVFTRDSAVFMVAVTNNPQGLSKEESHIPDQPTVVEVFSASSAQPASQER